MSMLLTMRKDIREIKRELRALRPSFSAFMLTNYTTQGVTRQPITFGNQNQNQSSSKAEARWT